LKQPGLRRLLIAAGALSLVTIGDGFLYLVLQDGGQIPNSYFPLLFVGTNLAYLSLAIPMGKLADRVGRGRVFVGGYLLLLGCYVIAGLNLGGIVGLLLVLLLLGTFYAATDGVLAALASLLVPQASRASGISAAQTFVALARFAASVGFGVLWQFAGLTTAVLVMTVGLIIAIAVAAWLLRIRSDSPTVEAAEPGAAR
jgi:MFS family permease